MEDIDRKIDTKNTPITQEINEVLRATAMYRAMEYKIISTKHAFDN